MSQSTTLFLGMDVHKDAIAAAVILVAAMGDLARFESPRELMKFLGLISSAYTSGEPHRQGSMTKAGNSHTRRVLVAGV